MGGFHLKQKNTCERRGKGHALAKSRIELQGILFFEMGHVFKKICRQCFSFLEKAFTFLKRYRRKRNNFDLLNEIQANREAKSKLCSPLTALILKYKESFFKKKRLCGAIMRLLCLSKVPFDAKKL